MTNLTEAEATAVAASYAASVAQPLAERRLNVLRIKLFQLADQQPRLEQALIELLAGCTDAALDAYFETELGGHLGGGPLFDITEQVDFAAATAHFAAAPLAPPQ